MLANAAETLVAVIEKLAAWGGDLLHDLTATRANRERLLKAADSVLPSLPEDGRRALRLRLNCVAVAMAGGLRANATSPTRFRRCTTTCRAPRAW